MKSMHPLALAVCASLIFCVATTSAYSEEQQKKKSYKERVAGEAASDVTDEDSVGYSKDAKEKAQKEALKVAAKYPLATRVEPDLNGSPALLKERNKMIDDFQAGKTEAATTEAEALKNNPKANANDKATAMRVLLIQMTKVEPENPAAIPMIEEILATNGLSNNDHFSLMLQLAQRELFNQEYLAALATANKFIAETKSENKDILSVKGNALFRAKRLPEAIAVLEKAHALDPKDQAITQILIKAYSEANQPAMAAALLKDTAPTDVADHGALVNLAINYRDAKEYEKAAAVIAQLRTSQQLIDERDYKTAMSIYSKMKDREADLAAVIEEGLKKGALQPTGNNLETLAEAYYYDNNIPKAISAWTQAAPLAKDGGTYLNLAVVQCQESLYADCKTNAMKAMQKGGVSAKDAWLEVSNAEAGLGNTEAAAAAKQKAGK